MTFRPWTRGAIALLLGCSLLSLPASSLADDEAQQAYRDGIALFEKGAYKQAAEAFRKAYSVKVFWKMHYNIGQSEVAAHRYGLALDSFETYLVEGGDDIQMDRREEVLAEIQRLRLLVGVIELAAEPGAELIIDGSTRGTVPFPGMIRVAAGEHQIIIRKDGEVLRSQKIKIAGGMTTKVDAMPETSNEPEGGGAGSSTDISPGGSAATEDGPRVKLISGIVLGGVGIVGIGLGTGFVIKGSKDNERYQDAKDAGNDAKADDIWNNDVRIDSAVALSGFIAGGAFLAAGATFIIIDVVQHKKGAAEDESVALLVAPDGIGFSF